MHRDICIGFSYSSDSNGVNRVSMSRVAETVGDKSLTIGEGGYIYRKDRE